MEYAEGGKLDLQPWQCSGRCPFKASTGAWYKRLACRRFANCEALVCVQPRVHCVLQNEGSRFGDRVIQHVVWHIRGAHHLSAFVYGKVYRLILVRLGYFSKHLELVQVTSVHKLAAAHGLSASPALSGRKRND